MTFAASSEAAFKNALRGQPAPNKQVVGQDDFLIRVPTVFDN
jgi:hypothetical protein